MTSVLTRRQLTEIIINDRYSFEIKGDFYFNIIKRIRKRYLAMNDFEFMDQIRINLNWDLTFIRHNIYAF